MRKKYSEDDYRFFEEYDDSNPIYLDGLEDEWLDAYIEDTKASLQKKYYFLFDHKKMERGKKNTFKEIPWSANDYAFFRKHFTPEEAPFAYFISGNENIQKNNIANDNYYMSLLILAPIILYLLKKFYKKVKKFFIVNGNVVIEHTNKDITKLTKTDSKRIIDLSLHI